MVVQGAQRDGLMDGLLRMGDCVRHHADLLLLEKMNDVNDLQSLLCEKV